jgi:YolD-like protein.
VNNSYDDIINLPHHVSITRPQMPLINRAAQFSPFSALTGYDSAIRETARLTDDRIELGESSIAELDMKLSILTSEIDNRPEITVTYFIKDAKKSGGAYVTITGAIKRIDEHERAILLVDGRKIIIDDVLEIESEIFMSLSL